jgi:nicotinate-nucleotide--dimethylbenzimidazole phosphoribosyltransferase
MGIGNTSSASLLMSSLCGIPLEQCAGRGTGLNDEQLSFKINTLLDVQKKHVQPKNAQEALKVFGGFEIAQMCGAMLAAYEKNMLLLVDGFITSCAYLCAFNINPAIKNNALFCHQSDENGHALLLNYLGEKPILNLGLRLGEGTGCALVYPIIESAVRFMNEMASFDSAKISEKL